MMAGQKDATAITRSRSLGWRSLTVTGVVAGILVLAAANVHLVYVALASQPDCVAHVKNDGADGTYRAAKPSC